MKYTLEVISDVVCPWCYIGKHRLSCALDALGGGDDITIKWRPFELNPGLPASGMDRQAYCRQKFGSVEYAKQLYGNIAKEARADGLPIELERIERTPNSRQAHRLIWFAEQTGLSDEMVDVLFNAYFVRGLDVGDSEILAALGTEIGFERNTIVDFLAGDEAATTIREWEEDAFDMGVQGVPGFVFNGQYLFSGAQAPESIRLILERCMQKAAGDGDQQDCDGE